MSELFADAIFAADPHWRGWIVAYFFLGGVSAGLFFLGSMLELVGRDPERALARRGYYLALPLIAICGLLLIADLDQPWRFWHMLLQSETGRPMLKAWSPMSLGSWALALYGALCTWAVLRSLVEDLGARRPRFFRLPAWLRQGALVRAGQTLGTLAGFFVASYTGALLTATSQPVWSESPWLAGLFLASSASTGASAMILLAAPRAAGLHAAVDKLHHIDACAILLELVTLLIWIVSLGDARDIWLATPSMRWLLGTIIGAGLILPLGLHARRNLLGGLTAPLAATLVVAGGLALRYAIVMAWR